MSQHIIEVNGCDDSTAIPMELTDAEFVFLKKFADAVNAAATYECKPTIDIDREYLDWDGAVTQYNEDVAEKKEQES